MIIEKIKQKFNKLMENHINKLDEIFENELSNLKNDLFSKDLPFKISVNEKERLDIIPLKPFKGFCKI